MEHTRELKPFTGTILLQYDCQRVWIRESFLSAYERASLYAVKLHLPRFC